MKKNMKVGVIAYRYNYYTNQRLIVNKVPEFDYKKVYDLFSLINIPAKKINDIASKKIFDTFNLNNIYQDFQLNQVDVIHFSNGISFGKTPWVSCFETILPRLRQLVTRHQGGQARTVQLDSLTKRSLEAILNPACLQIIAWSACSANMEVDLLSEFSNEYQSGIIKKMSIIHPPQDLLIDDYKEKEIKTNEPIRFILVGSSFFRKGGKEILLAFEKLKQKFNYPIQLIIISSLQIDNYATQETQEDLAWAKAKILENQDWIIHYPGLSNQEALTQMKSAHVGLLPSYAETYGFSALELQASGCPVITTNIRAFPEINNEQVGWLIDVPKNNLNEAIYTTIESREIISNRIIAGIENIVHQIVSDPNMVEKKGRAALEKIKHEHSPALYASKLEAIYRRALLS